jgi:hypothetical protein
VVRKCFKNFKNNINNKFLQNKEWKKKTKIQNNKLVE